MTWAQQAKLIAPDADSDGGELGFAVALSGDTAVVGAPRHGESGTAYVFVRSGPCWRLEHELGGNDFAPGSLFGVSVALSGDTAVVGAPGRAGMPGETSVPSAAFVFARAGTAWTLTQNLADAASLEGKHLGASVAVSGDTAIVGAAGTGDAAYVFVRSGAGWTLQQALTLDAPHGAASDASVALSGDTALLGMPVGDGPGAAYVFVRSGTTWTQQQAFAASDPAPNDGFGTSVVVEGDTAVVGSMQHSAIYVFYRSGTTWTQTQEIATTSANVHFSSSVALGGATVIVGSAPVGKGAYGVDVFAPSGGVLALAEVMTPSDPSTSSLFGTSVAAEGDTVIVGALGTAQAQGAAYVVLQGTADAGTCTADGAACTSPTDCASGYCVSGVCCAVASCPAEGPCNAAERCEPGTGQCSSTPTHEGMACDDHDACTPPRHLPGRRLHRPPELCAPVDACHEFGACDPSNGQCSSPPRPDGTPCPDATCTAGVCGVPVAAAPSAGGCTCGVGDSLASGGLLAALGLALPRRAPAASRTLANAVTSGRPAQLLRRAALPAQGQRQPRDARRGEIVRGGAARHEVVDEVRREDTDGGLRGAPGDGRGQDDAAGHEADRRGHGIRSDRGRRFRHGRRRRLGRHRRACAVAFEQGCAWTVAVAHGGLPAVSCSWSRVGCRGAGRRDARDGMMFDKGARP